jgi:hypothetical protein
MVMESTLVSADEGFEGYAVTLSGLDSKARV